MNAFSLRVALTIGLAFASATVPAADDAAIRASINRATTFLVESGQADDGSFSAHVGPAVTALAITGLVKSGTPPDSPAVQKAIAYLLTFKQPTGGIHPPDSLVSNYETAIAMMALAACNTDGRFSKEIAAAVGRIGGPRALRSGLRRRRLRQEEPTRPVEHGVLDRGAAERRHRGE